MPAAILTQGLTSIRDSLKTLVTHVVVSDDTAVFALANTGINPTAAATSTHVELATDADVDATTFDSTISIDGTTEFTGKSIFSIGVAKGAAIRSATGSGGVHTGVPGTVGTDTISRTVRTLGIGVQSGDIYTIGCRVKAEDNS